MRQINSYFLTGTLGMLFTSIFHIILGTFTSEETAASTGWILYPVFAGFLIVGTKVMMQKKELRVPAYDDQEH